MKATASEFIRAAKLRMTGAQQAVFEAHRERLAAERDRALDPTRAVRDAALDEIIAERKNRFDPEDEKNYAVTSMIWQAHRLRELELRAEHAGQQRMLLIQYEEKFPGFEQRRNQLYSDMFRRFLTGSAPGKKRLLDRVRSYFADRRTEGQWVLYDADSEAMYRTHRVEITTASVEASKAHDAAIASSEDIREELDAREKQIDRQHDLERAATRAKMNESLAFIAATILSEASQIP